MPHSPPLCHGSNWLFDYGSAYVCLSFRRWKKEAEEREGQYGGKVKPRLWGCSPCDWPYRVWLYDSSTSSNLNWPCNAVERVLKGLGVGWDRGKPLCTFICGVYVMRKGKQLCGDGLASSNGQFSEYHAHTHTYTERDLPIAKRSERLRMKAKSSVAQPRYYVLDRRFSRLRLFHM